MHRTSSRPGHLGKAYPAAGIFRAEHASERRHCPMWSWLRAGTPALASAGSVTAHPASLPGPHNAGDGTSSASKARRRTSERLRMPSLRLKFER